jgi:hypothetical protein
MNLQSDRRRRGRGARGRDRRLDGYRWVIGRGMLWSHALGASCSGLLAPSVVVLPVGVILPTPLRLLLDPARHAPLRPPSRSRALRRTVPVAPIAHATEQEQATAQRAEPLHELEQTSRTSPPRSGQPLLARAMHGAAADGLFRPCRTARSANFGPSPFGGRARLPDVRYEGQEIGCPRLAPIPALAMIGCPRFRMIVSSWRAPV